MALDVLHLFRPPAFLHPECLETTAGWKLVETELCQDEPRAPFRSLQSKLGLWQRRFGSDPGIIGRTISMNEIPFTVLGVMPPEFDFPIGAEFWAPLTFTPASAARRSGRTLFGVGRLRDSVSVEQGRRPF